MSSPRILIVEDDRDGCRSVKEAVEDAGFVAIAVSSGEAAVAEFRKESFEVVLTDLMLPGMDGMAVLTQIRRMDPNVPVLIMTAYGTVSSAVHALKAGAYDYISKPLDLEDIQSKVSRAAETARLRLEVASLRKAVTGRNAGGAMVAESAGMKAVAAQVASLADSNATVLVLGESGTGKEVVARALHYDGKRRAGPFVAVNCGAFMETLLESELFGHEKGAFTGAAAQRKGSFERADGGTLFLDEVGNAPKSVQVKLLRVLEERELFRVGGQDQVKVDVRVISASNRDLDELVEEGDFREDLLYRLKVVVIRIPPLRERREDIRPLVDRFIAMSCENHGRHFSAVEPEFYQRLEAYDWPGNVRQLRNVVEASVVMTSGQSLMAADVRMDTPPKVQDDFSVPDGMTFAGMEKEILLASLRKHEGNRTLAAEKLGISRRTIQRKIKEYGLPF
ncbi:MAG: sigma-54 dependent transcriptional regulator [bacterium]